MNGSNEPPLRSRTAKTLNTLKTKIGNRNAVVCFQGAAFVSLLIITLGAAFLVYFTPTSPRMQNDADISTGAENRTASLFLDVRERLIVPLDLITIQNSALAAAAPPITVEPRVLGALVGISEEEFVQERGGVVDYIAEEGDTLSSIADKFGLSLNTLLWANDLSKSSVIQPGQKLVILPVDGVVHHVKKGDTISGIAKLYQAKASEIIAFNNLSSENDIYIGDILIVPGGKMPVSRSTRTYVSTPKQVPVASSYFICPVGSSCVLTQGLHWYNAVDFQASCGSPVFAAAGGKVLKVALTNSTSRWAFGGAGNHITILHPNGTITFYGHLRSSLVSPGQQVSQGQMIATSGGMPGTPGAGLSTGCHLHFEVEGARNPFAY